MKITEEHVRNSKLPAHVVPTETFTPLSHGDALRLLDEAMSRANLEVNREIDPSYTVTHEGARLFATMTLKDQINEDAAMKIGITNSYDKSLSLKVGFGSHVFVCANGCFFADIVGLRKHTNNILSNIAERLDSIFESYVTFRDSQRLFFDDLKQTQLSDKDAHHLIVRAAQNNAITGGEIIKVAEQWHNPRFEAFNDRNAWSLHNAFTDVYKRGAGRGGVAERNGNAFIERATALTNVMTKELNISRPELVEVN